MRVINFVVSLFNLCLIKIHAQNYYQIFCITICRIKAIGTNSTNLWKGVNGWGGEGSTKEDYFTDSVLVILECDDQLMETC